MPKKTPWVHYIAKNPDRITSDTGTGGFRKALKDQHGIDMPRSPQSEHELIEQKSVIRWARSHSDVWPALRWLYHPRNGGSRTRREIRDSNDEGVTPGILDLHLPHPAGIYHGAFIEMKWGSNKLSALQKAVHRLRQTGRFLC